MQTKFKSFKYFILLSAITLQIFSVSCKKAERIENTDQVGTGNEVRITNVQELNNKAVVTWIDPYITNAAKILVKDLQSNQEQTVTIGVQKATFDITDATLSSYRYEIKVVDDKGKVSNGIVARLFRNWAQNVYSRIDYNSTETPQGGLFFKNSPYSGTVKVFDIREDESLARITSAAMQGIINRQFGQSYLVTRESHFHQLTDLNIGYNLISPGATSKNKGLAALFNQYKHLFSKIIIYDGEPNAANNNMPVKKYSWSMALMKAAHENGIPVSQTVYDFMRANLDLSGLAVEDIRNKWTSEAAAYDWALDNYENSVDKHMIFAAGLRSDFLTGPWTMFDYTVASKGFCFWLNEENSADRAIMDKIFARLKFPVGSSVFGFGMNEIGDHLNKITNNKNAGFVVSDYYANGSFWSSFPNKSFKQRQGIATDVKPGKVYVSLNFSDGDNIQFGQNSLYDIFRNDPNRGKVPVGVTMASVLQEINPKLLEYYYKNATNNEEFTAGPSGFQFIYGDYFQQSGKYAEWLGLNNKWLATAGFHVAHLWIANGANFKQYMDASNLALIMDGEMHQTANAPASHKFNGKTVRLDQGTHCWTEGDLYKDLMSVTPSSRRPIFRAIYLLTNHYGYDNNKLVMYERILRELKKAEQEMPNTFEFMLPSDLAASMKKYIEGGGIY